MVEWNGIQVRPGRPLEILKLSQKGLTESEIRQVTGADCKAMQRLRNKPDLAVFLPKRFCLFCGESLSQAPPQRRYCSSRCYCKARYDRRNAVQGQTTRRVEQAKRSRAIELFARGLDGGSIARYLDVSPREIKSWLYIHPIKRASELCPELVPLLPLKHRLNRAKSAEEWRNILHDAAGGFGMPGLVVLVTEPLHGGGAPGRYAAIVLEKLRQNLVEGVQFAFCNLLKNAVTTIEWRGENVHLTRTLKLSGTFLWPGTHLGDFLTVTRAGFSHLLTYPKSAKPRTKSLENP
jgi:predicted nucleic acid-binding Zn ribbon protein